MYFAKWQTSFFMHGLLGSYNFEFHNVCMDEKEYLFSEAVFHIFPREKTVKTLLSCV
jgi:hypothetical protein